MGLPSIQVLSDCRREHLTQNATSSGGAKSSVILLFARFWEMPGKAAPSKLLLVGECRLRMKLWKPGGTRCPMADPKAAPGAVTPAERSR
jgi:hypothetical protein